LQAFPEAFFVSTGVVALGEIGDKTQLLALVLAARWRRPWAIACGILVATLLNHALAGALGAVVAAWLGPQWLRWIVGASFLAMAAWMLVPDEIGEVDEQAGGHGVFVTTALCFFLAEMGDKTQIATVALAARYAELLAVVAGSTLGLMLANVPAVFVGQKAAQRLPLRLVHAAGAVVFAALGVLTLLGLPDLL
jgi:putative Ca2+/H+ antiporter (TMEM165/GDT1 family)